MPAFEMEWRDVLFASYPVEPGVVEPHLPDRLSVDTFEGNAYLSVVPFVIGDIRPKGLPATVGLTTPELTLRTYVRLDDTPGIYFFNLDADDVLGVLGARIFNHLPYYFADMEFDRGPPIRFESRRTTPGARPCRFAGTYRPDGEPFVPEAGTVEHFLTERYRYFTESQDGAMRYANIEHEAWTLRPATWDVSETTIFAANGFDTPESEPVLSYSRGVSVEASGSKRWGR